MHIHHDADAQRFQVDVDGHRGILAYRLDDRAMTITHTDVPRAIGGRGIAAALTRTALDTARREQWTVVPQCSYAAAFIRRHPEFADLLD